MPQTSRRRTLAVGLVVAALIAPQLLVPDASGDAIGDKKAEARRVAARLSELQQEGEILAEDYNEAQIRLAEVRVRVSAAESEVDRTNRRIERRRRDLARYAVSAYTRGGLDELNALLETSGSDLPVRMGYASAAVGDKADLVASLRAAKSDGTAMTARLRRTQKEADQARALVEKKRKAASAAVDEQRQLHERVQGELKTLVVAEQARVAARERARAEAAAREAAAREARAEAAARAAATREARARQAAATRASKELPAPSTEPTRPRVSAPTSSSTTTRPSTTTTARAPSRVVTRRTVPPAPPTTRAPAPVRRPAPAPAPAPVGQGAGAAIAAARSVLGVRYTWAGASPSAGFDCSGLVMWAWAHGGKSLSHSSRVMYSQARKIPISAAQPGDLIFYGSPMHHVGLYIGGGQMIHAPHTGSYVKLESIYYWSELVGAGRV